MFIAETKEKIIRDINSLLGVKVFSPRDFLYPPNMSMGDISLPCFRAGKELSRPPAEVAAQIVSALDKGEIIASLSADGGYLNIKLSIRYLADKVLSEIESWGNKYGENDFGQKQKVVVEYSNGNTHKDYHVGHLRNIAYGDAVCRLLSANGFTAIPVSYVNDFGIHTAKTLWAYLEFYKDVSLPVNKGAFLGEIYAKAVKELDVSRTGKQMVQMIMKKIENREGSEYALWQKTREWSIAQFDKIYSELGIKFTKIYYESEMIDSGRKLINELLARKVLKESQGAVIADLTEYNLGVLVVLRSDNTAAYPVADIPLAIKKIKDFNLDRSIYVVDNRQSLYFKQLFKILALLGYKQEFIHLDYEFVNLPSGTMSSRSGNVVTYENLRNELLKKVEAETRKRRPDWPEEKIRKVSKVLTVATMKFEMLKVDKNQVITFDYKKALNFQGYTAAYIEYAFVRLSAILHKAGSFAHNDGVGLTEDIEKHLLMLLAKFPEVVSLSGREYNPAEIAKYVFLLAQTSNDYYHRVNILKADERERNARLHLLGAIQQVMKNALTLLGINVLTEM